MAYQDLDMPTKIIKENAITFHLDFFYLPFNKRVDNMKLLSFLNFVPIFRKHFT